MKRTLATIATLASCLLMSAAAQTHPATAATASTTPSGPAKVAVIGFQEAVTQTNDFQRRYADLQKKYDPKRQELKALSDDIANLQKQLQAQAATLSDADRAQRAKVIDDKQKQLKRSGEDAQGDFQQAIQETFSGVAAKVAETLDAYAKEHGYTVVLDEGSQQLPVVLYASQSADITKAVVEAYNLKSGIPAPAPQPAGAAPSVKAPGAAKAPAAH